jgi:chromate transporter
MVCESGWRFVGSDGITGSLTILALLRATPTLTLPLSGGNTAGFSAAPPRIVLMNNQETKAQDNSGLAKPNTPAGPDGLAPKPSLFELFVAFTKLGVTSFGGGVSGWMRLEFVVRKRWMTADSFYTGFSMAQALPGVNVLNLAIWIGFELHGTAGVLAAAAGVLIPPAIFVVVLGEFFERISGYALTHFLLAGVAIGGLAMALSLGLAAARHRIRDITSALVFLATFSSIFIFHIPMPIVLAVLTPISIGIAYWQGKHRT